MAITPGAEADIDPAELEALSKHGLLVRYKIPLKTGPTLLYALNWPTIPSESQIREVVCQQLKEKVRQRFEVLDGCGATGSVEQKILNTHAFIDYCCVANGR